jgi:hypothetical protein
VIATLLVASGSLDTHAGLWNGTKKLALLVVNLLTSPFATISSVIEKLLVDTTRLLAITGGFLLAYLLMKITDRRLSGFFSRFWFEQQQNLRAALKHARKEAKHLVASGTSSDAVSTMGTSND